MENQLSQLQKRIKQLIVYLGEEGPQFFQRDIKKLYSNLSDLLMQNNTSQNNFIINTFVKCINLLSSKIQLYATVFALLWNNNKNQQASEKIIDKVQENMQNAFDVGDVIAAKNSLIFIGELMNIGIFNSFTFVTLLHSIINEAEKTLDQSQDYYLQIIIQALPHFYESLLEKSDFEFQSLVDTLKQLMGKRKQVVLKQYRITKDEEQGSDWLSVFFSSLFNDIQSEHNMFQQKDKVYTQCNLCTPRPLKCTLKLTFLNKVSAHCCQVSYQHSYFLSTTHSLTELDKISIIRQLQEIISLFKEDKQILLRKLLIYTLHSQQHQNQQDIMPKLILQAIFNEIVLATPMATNSLVMYSSLFTALIEANSSDSNVQQLYQTNINKIFDHIFQNLDNYTFSFDEKINKVLAQYLTNNIECFDFSGLCLNYQDHSVRQQVFLQKLFARVFRLMNYERIEDQDLIPEFILNRYLKKRTEGEKKYQSKFFDSMCQADAEIVMDQMNQKVDDQQMTLFLNNNHIEATGQDLNTIFIDCFLVKTSNSLTHLKTLSERYKNTLKSIVLAKESYQVNLLNDLQAFWKHQFIPIRNYINYFLMANLIKRNIVILWIFKQVEKEPQLINILNSNYFEIFDNLLLQFFYQQSTQEDQFALIKYILRKFAQSLINLNNKTEKQSMLYQYFRQFLIDYDDQIKIYGVKIIQELEEINQNQNLILTILTGELKQIYQE